MICTNLPHKTLIIKYIYILRCRLVQGWICIFQFLGFLINYEVVLKPTKSIFPFKKPGDWKRSKPKIISSESYNFPTYQSSKLNVRLINRKLLICWRRKIERGVKKKGHYEWNIWTIPYSPNLKNRNCSSSMTNSVGTLVYFFIFFH